MMMSYDFYDTVVGLGRWRWIDFVLLHHFIIHDLRLCPDLKCAVI
jgi:hypothetical protein